MIPTPISGAPEVFFNENYADPIFVMTAITRHLLSVTMGSSNLTLIFATLFLYLLLHFPSQAEARALKSPAKCPKLLDQGIVVNALDMVRKESMKTSKFFDGLANGKGTVPAFKPALRECASDFKAASGLMNLKVLEGEFATMDVNYALDDARSCETKLAMDKVHIQSIPAAIKSWKKFLCCCQRGCPSPGKSSKIIPRLKIRGQY
ncbi:hypothetical protein OIU85_018210 [Salix viminalis]|uniref:Pectinesterase inhibitor domain-containing protein n=1 Tax=Salix viminalis TaxID=40686 RepID=A0A9Q0UT83_SALVM|nr:hypothetical protein OIU85_018210 [Salix viminalis]